MMPLMKLNISLMKDSEMIPDEEKNINHTIIIVDDNIKMRLHEI